MKQSELKRKTPLRADPSKVRAWEQRSRQAAIDRVREVQDGVDPPPPQERRPVKFRPPEPARSHVCVRCREREATDWHHWLSQELIRVYVRGLRLGTDEHRRELRRRIQDRRNLAPMCHDCHMDGEHDANDRRFTVAEVPLEAFSFAAELGQEWVERLHTEYRRRGAGL